MKKTFLLLVTTFLLSTNVLSAAEAKNSTPVAEKEGISAQVLIMKETVTKDNSARLREESMEKANAVATDSWNDQIKRRLIEAWGTWVPDYEGWLKWSSSLYTPDSMIYAIGETPQRFADYQASMKAQRDAFTMEMGPIMQIAVDGNTASLIYYMFMTPKNEPEKTIKIIVTEYNTFGIVNGELMVTRLDLYTGH